MGLSPITFFSCFSIGEVPRSPGKWNWTFLSFLLLILIFEQCVFREPSTLGLVFIHTTYLQKAIIIATQVADHEIFSIKRHASYNAYIYTQIFSPKKTGFSPIKNIFQNFSDFCLPLFYATFQCKP